MGPYHSDHPASLPASLPGQRDPGAARELDGAAKLGFLQAYNLVPTTDCPTTPRPAGRPPPLRHTWLCLRGSCSSMGLGHSWRPHPCQIEYAQLLRAAHRRRHDPRRTSHSVLLTGLWVVEEYSTWHRPADFVPSPWSQHTVCDLEDRDQARPTHTSNARSPHHTPHPNRLWWQSRSALDETLAAPPHCRHCRVPGSQLPS